MTDERSLQLKITLAGSKPPIWRRVRVSESMSLEELHRVIQIAMGWDDAHLHSFDVKGTRFPGFTEDIVAVRRRSNPTTLRDLHLRSPKQKFRYMYDFGDDWLHEITVESVEPIDRTEELPVCVAGRRACPPEDCGGLYGYYRLLEAVSDPADPEHDELSEWISPDFDPAAFDRETVNSMLRRAFTDRSRLDTGKGWYPDRKR